MKSVCQSQSSAANDMSNATPLSMVCWIWQDGCLVNETNERAWRWK